MKTIYMKLTPRPGTPQESLGITWFSTMEMDGGAEKTLHYVQRAADKQNLGIDYSLIDFTEYAAMRATRKWLMTEPGDEVATKQYRLDLVRAGVYLDTADIIGFVCDGWNDHTVQVVTAYDCTTINIKTSVIVNQKFTPDSTTTKQLVRAAKAETDFEKVVDQTIKAGITILPVCSKCLKPWKDHDFGVPEPYCP